MKFWLVKVTSDRHYRILTKFEFFPINYKNIAKKFNISELSDVLDQLFDDIEHISNLRNFLFVCKSDDIVVFSYQNNFVFAKILNNHITNASQDAPFFLNDDIGFFRSVKILYICDKFAINAKLQEFLSAKLSTITEISDDKICALIINEILNA